MRRVIPPIPGKAFWWYVMSENKVNVKVTQALMGHAKVITTLDIYTDTFDEEIHKSIGEVEGMMALGENQTDEDES